MRLISARQEAKILGDIIYRNGKTCKFGHDDRRYVSSGGCVTCSIERSIARIPEIKRWIENNREKHRAYGRKWRTENLDKVAAKQRRHYHANKEKYAQRKKIWEATEAGRAWRIAYRAANVEKLREYDRRGRLKNLEKHRYKNKLWRQANPGRHKKNPEAYRTYCRNRRARLQNVGGSHSASDIENLLMLQRRKCAMCKESVKKGHHVDHIVPISLGGSNFPSNLQILCPKCNFRKHDKHPAIFAREMGLLI